jgi:hypothetical protein
MRIRSFKAAGYVVPLRFRGKRSRPIRVTTVISSKDEGQTSEAAITKRRCLAASTVRSTVAERHRVPSAYRRLHREREIFTKHRAIDRLSGRPYSRRRGKGGFNSYPLDVAPSSSIPEGRVRRSISRGYA